MEKIKSTENTSSAIDKIYTEKPELNRTIADGIYQLAFPSEFIAEILKESDKKKKEKFLLRYFTNTDKKIFAFKDKMSQEAGGALIARFSRADGDPRDLYYKEFTKQQNENMEELPSDDDVKTKADENTQKRTRKFFKDAYDKYGDESVGEMTHVTVMLKDISIIVAKEIEAMRRGGFIEQSTRYIKGLAKRLINGKFRYREEAKLKALFGEKYTNVNDELFETYNDLFEPIKSIVEKEYPMLETDEKKAWEASINSKVCDILRELLPLGLEVTMGVTLNARDWSELINKMRSSNLDEIRNVGDTLLEEVSQVIPTLMDRTKGKHGVGMVEYNKKIDAIYERNQPEIKEELNENSKESEKDPKEILKAKLLEMDENPIERVAAAFYYKSKGWDYNEALSYFIGNKGEAIKVLDELSDLRQNRFHTLIEAFEAVHMKVELEAPFSTYKELQRHRRKSIFRKTYSALNTFYTPKEIYKLPQYLKEKYFAVMNNAVNFIKEGKAKYPELSEEFEYIVPHGMMYKWMEAQDAREVSYILVLRGTNQAHFTCRTLMHNLYNEIEKKDEQFAKYLGLLMDWNPDSLNRREAFNKIEKKGGNFE